MVETGSGVRSFGYTGGTGGAVSIINSGTITATGADGDGILVLAGNSATTIDNSGQINGASGLVLAGGSNTIVNKGLISGAAGEGIIATGTTSLDNADSIVGSGGIAVQLSAADETVTLRTSSNVTGMIAAGGGTDAANLIGTTSTAASSQTIAAFSGFDSLDVHSGYWTAPSTNGSVFTSSVTIAAGSSLDDANGATGLSVSAPIVDNGTLVVRSSAGSAGSTFGGSVVTGTGNVLLTGAGNVTLDGTNSIQTTETTTIDGGTTTILTGTQGGNFVTNSGGTLQIGTGGTSGLFTGNLVDNGALFVNRSDTYTIGGSLTGSGTLTKSGAGQLVLASGYAFTGTTNILGGSIKVSGTVAPTTQLAVTGSGQIDLSGSPETVAALSGDSAAVSINLTGGSLTVNQATSTTFAGNLTGDGSLVKAGSGRLNVAGANNYTGPTTVSGGMLSVNGSIVSATTVASDGTLGGNGTISAPVMIAAGGIIAPGSSIGTLNINGNLTLNTGSIYEVEANAAGQADRINVTGIATLAGTVQVVPTEGSYPNLTS